VSELDYLVVRVGDNRFGVDAATVQDVFHPRGLTPVPTAAAEVVGILNLRGRIVTAICARRRLGMADRCDGAPEPKAVGTEIGGDAYGLIVDDVEDVLRLDEAEMLTTGELPKGWEGVTFGAYRLPAGLLIILDLPRLLAPAFAAAA